MIKNVSDYWGCRLRRHALGPAVAGGRLQCDGVRHHVLRVRTETRSRASRLSKGIFAIPRNCGMRAGVSMR